MKRAIVRAMFGLLMWMIAVASSWGQNAVPEMPAAKAKIAEFAWMTGRWVGELGTNKLEQIFSSPEKGLIMGMFRLYDGDKTILLEFVSIRETPEGLEMRFRHFGPTLDDWEKGEALLLKLVKHTAEDSVWENPVSGRPKRSILQRRGKDAFFARSELLGDNKNPAGTIEVLWQRSDVPIPKK